MTGLELTKEIVKILDSKKANDIKAVKVDDITTIADYFVIASGSSSTQVKALSEEVEYKISQLGIEPHHTEGNRTQWVLLDYISVVVHIFYEETREFYDLEHLWNDGEQLDISKLLED